MSFYYNIPGPCPERQFSNEKLGYYMKQSPGPEVAKPGAVLRGYTLDWVIKHQKIFSRKLYNAKCQDPME